MVFLPHVLNHSTPITQLSYTIPAPKAHTNPGTSSLVDEVTREPRIANMSLLVETIVKLKRDGHRVIIVSSGGIAVGLKRLGITDRPKGIAEVQAVAAVGQARLIGLWDDLFRQMGQPIAQILLTRNDLADRTQYLNATATLNELLNMGVIPIVNENDTLSAYEIRFGDNDTLSAITAGMANADYLFLMTDVDCLYTANPRSDPTAKPILIVDDISSLKVDVSSTGSNVGTGGMTTKLIAAELATSVGTTTVICKSSVPGNIRAIVKYNQKYDVEADAKEIVTPEYQAQELERLVVEDVPLHTKFIADKEPIKDRQFWLLHGLSAAGKIYIDGGCYKALTRKNRAGMLPAGLLGTVGTFHTSETVSIHVGRKLEDGGWIPHPDFADMEVGRALVNYGSTEMELIKGLQSNQIESVLGFMDSEYLAFRDNIAFLPHTNAPSSPA